MEREAPQALARLRRLLLELHALLPGTLLPGPQDAIEDVVAPGFRGRAAR